MGTRYVFRYNNSYIEDRINEMLKAHKCELIKVDDNATWYAGNPDSMGDYVLGIENADVVIYPPEGWINDSERRNIGEILEVEVQIHLKGK